MSTAPIYKPLEIEVTDFGPIAKAKLDLRPLTVFVGPSNTGKSYLAMLIYAFHHSIGTFGYPRLGQANHYRRLFSYRFGWAMRERDELSDDEVSAVLDWGTDVASRIAEEKNPAGFPLRVSNSVAEIIVPMLVDKDLLFSELEKEIARCFGSEGTARLKRIGSSHNSRVMLVRRMSDDTGASDLLKYDFTINGEGRIYAASIPDNIPLSIEKDYASLWDWEDLTEPVSSIGLPRIYESSERKRRAIAVLSDIIEVVASSIVNPLNRMAHYLPADRAGVMHAHRVVVQSLIQRSSRAALQREEPLPALSGVLADFLEQLIGLGDLPAFKRKEGLKLSHRLEVDILRGKVHEKQSATGYPIFSYQPAGSKDEIPLMRASSMVSELAPVVLYLRHLVQPGDVLIIEEPESHLHPGMQAAFMRQLAAAVRSGVRVMLTTHSDYILEELANLVRMSELPEEQRADLKGADQALSPDEVGVWLFEPGQQNEGSRVKEIPLDRDSGTFPAGYGAITEALYNTSVEIDSRIIESKNDQ